ncbi:MAG: EF-P lysine aminoacylase GenX [Deltaproteobacteria bacterium]|nr:EF-P lysine aminoacylase GenX [Deltaproteobacteria bacterium]
MSDRVRLHGRGGKLAANLRARSRARAAVRAFFDARGYLEVDTPQLVPSPGVEVHLDAFEVLGADAPRFLITSPEYQMKRLIAGGLGNVYQLCHCFRRDELGALHQPEFTMLEWYRVDAGMADVVADTEALVAHVATAMHGAPTLPGPTGTMDVSPPWDRLTVRDAFRRFAGVEVDSLLRDEARFFETLVTDIEPKLGVERPTVLYAYPAQMASLARLSPEDPTVAERFEVYVRGIELANGFGELTDAEEQRTRCEADLAKRARLGKPPYPLDERFLAALREGMPSSGGVALGFDRLVMLLLGEPVIDDVVAIPERAL